MRPIPKNRLSNEAAHDKRTALVKDMVTKESAMLDARTAKLRALRLAKEAEDAANIAAAPPPPKKPKPKPKVKRA